MSVNDVILRGSIQKTFTPVTILKSWKKSAVPYNKYVWAADSFHGFMVRLITSTD